MGLVAAAVHLPIHQLREDQLSAAGMAPGHAALRVPWWDEDPLTLAVEAALGLGDQVQGVSRVLIALDESPDQPGLVPLALDLDVSMTVVSGPDAGLEALVSANDMDGATLVVAGGAVNGGAGVAVLVESGRGVPIVDVASARGGTLAAGGVDPQKGLEALKGEGPVLAPQPRLARGHPVRQEALPGIQVRVGDAGAAAALLELVAHLGKEGGPCRCVTGTGGRVIAVAVGEGALDVPGLRGPAHDTTLAAYRQLREADPVPWAEASQGAYVSIEAYEADPERRYGARTAGAGRVLAVTTVEAGPPGEFLRQHEAAGPYDVAIIERDDGERAIGQLAGPPGQVRIDDAVVPVLRRLFSLEGRMRYAIKWKRAP